MTSLDSIRKKIPPHVRLIAVSKGQSVEKIKTVFATGVKDFGENYAQEFLQKEAELAGYGISWHFLGHLQKNKVGKIIDKIEWLHSLDSFELAETIQKKAQRPVKCLLEIKLSEEETKTGCSPEEALQLIPKLKELSKIDLRGLMTVPPFEEDPEKSRPFFKQLSSLLKTINDRYLYKQKLTELSIGMSHDFEVAIQEGATMVRVGTAIFGPRVTEP
ncbi:MAG: YggS family pyridoxal phosphate-dependent enzyme [Deltaproteobacteria bacterium]|nr:YggS family pyridoxal phosphate-dependent enzyme [Deltaproteobacteria bacterium]